MLWAALLLTSAFAASAQAQVAPLDVHDQSRGEHTIRLSAAGMFGLAQLALSKGDPETAFAIYTALETNPDADIRAEARFRHARQLLEQKRNGDAAVLLRRLARLLRGSSSRGRCSFWVIPTRRCGRFARSRRAACRRRSSG
jgi:hypothetical protein